MAIHMSRRIDATHERRWLRAKSIAHAELTESWVKLQIQAEAMRAGLPPMGSLPKAESQGLPSRNPQ